MPDTTIILKIFNKDELLLSDQQTREALKFFFPANIKEIDSCLITDNTKSFAQGLLVEAIDLTYKIAYVFVLWETIINQIKYRKKTPKPVKSFAKDALGNWFKYATTTDRANVKILESVRVSMNQNFKTYVNTDILAEAKNRIIFVGYIEN